MAEVAGSNPASPTKIPSWTSPDASLTPPCGARDPHVPFCTLRSLCSARRRQRRIRETPGRNLTVREGPWHPCAPSAVRCPESSCTPFVHSGSCAPRDEGSSAWVSHRLPDSSSIEFTFLVSSEGVMNDQALVSQALEVRSSGGDSEVTDAHPDQPAAMRSVMIPTIFLPDSSQHHDPVTMSKDGYDIAATVRRVETSGLEEFLDSGGVGSGCGDAMASETDHLSNGLSASLGTDDDVRVRASRCREAAYEDGGGPLICCDAVQCCCEGNCCQPQP